MLIMFSLSLSFETLPLSSLHLALLSGPVCYALHKSGKHTLTPEYTAAGGLCRVYICAGVGGEYYNILLKMHSNKSKK